MSAFFDAFATVLAFFYDLVPNYAVAIILLTLAVMIVVTPLTLKGTRSMMVMQRLQPEMKKIQQRYKDDREKLNAELLKFYKENDINPLGGCLPLLVQAPIFLVLYQVLRGLTRRATDMGFDVGWVSGQLGLGNTPGAPPDIVRVFDPAYLEPSTAMYQALHRSTTMTSFGIDLAESPSEAFSTGFIHFLPFLVLIAIVAVTGFVQQRQIQGRNPNAQINPQQQMIMKIMPIFLPVISFGLPAGLVLYFAVSNLYRIGQQAFISRSIYGISRKDKAGERSKAKGKAAGGKPPAKGSGGSARGKAAPKAAPDVIDVSSSDGPDAKAGGPASSPNPRSNRSAKKRPARQPNRSTKPDTSGQAAAPALQPRARKNKKR
jgi:YidC/Oxa1 family membrane protein insertase